MHAVRKHILEILKEQRGGATVAELAERLAMAPVSVRHHLDILQGDNLICVERLERKGNVGRPQQVYALTGEANSYFPNNFATLAGKLVEQIKLVLPPDQVACAFRAMAHQIAGELGAAPEISGVDRQERQGAFQQQLERITDFLSERGYLARWEAAAVASNTHKTLPSDELNSEGDIYLLHKHNCPYAGVSTHHPELCLMDQALIDELFGQSCERVTSVSKGDPCCTYRIRANGHARAGAPTPGCEDTLPELTLVAAVRRPPTEEKVSPAGRQGIGWRVDLHGGELPAGDRHGRHG